MFGLKRKKETTAEKDSGNGKEKLARFLAGKLVRGQRRTAELLTRIDKRCSTGQRKALMIFLGLCWAVYCSYVLIGAVSGPSKQKININRIRADTTFNTVRRGTPIKQQEHTVRDSLQINSKLKTGIK